MIGLPILTAAALANGLNPCGIGMTITFLGYLLVFGGNKRKGSLLKIGAVYVLSVFLTYLMTGLLFYSLAYYMQRLWLASVFKYILGGLIVGAGLIQIKDVFLPNIPIHLRMDIKGFNKISGLMAKASLPVAFLVGFLTTMFSTPCMMPLYVGTATVIARSGLPMIAVLGYFLYYNFIFILPMIIVWLVMVAGKEVVEMKEIQHKTGKWMRLVLGLFMVGVGIWLFK